MLLIGTILSLGLIIALMVKRKETPTNFYLLGAFVSSFFNAKTVEKLNQKIPTASVP